MIGDLLDICMLIPFWSAFDASLKMDLLRNLRTGELSTRIGNVVNRKVAALPIIVLQYTYSK